MLSDNNEEHPEKQAFSKMTLILELQVLLMMNTRKASVSKDITDSGILRIVSD
jgi:hypothetical protein